MAAGKLVAGIAGVLLALFFLPRSASCSGFLINEQGAKAAAMADAFTAQADDPSAIYYNPAGITQLKGSRVSFGANGIMPGSTFGSDGNPVMGTPPGETSHTKGRVWVTPNGYFSTRINDVVSAGLGVYSPFGLGTEWPRDFEGRYALGALRSYAAATSVSPVVSVEPVKSLSIGVGPYFQYLDVDLRNLVFAGVPAPPLAPGRNADATLMSRLTGTDWAAGWTLGVLYRPSKDLSFGASYLSGVTHNLTGGRQELTRLTDGSVVLRQSAGSSVSLPATLRFGAAFKPGKWTVEADAQWTEWSSFRTLRVDLANGATIMSPQNWHNAWALRVGGQYRWNRYIDLRAGFAWDGSPIPRTTLNPMLPSGNRNIYCVGLGINLQPVTIDLAYDYVQDSDKGWNNQSGNVNAGTTTVTRVTGSFSDTSAHIVSANVTFRF